MRHITVDIGHIDRLADEIKSAADWMERKQNELAQRLAEIGVENARIGFNSAKYDGTSYSEVYCEQTGPGRYTVRAEGNAVLFIEFGAGLIGTGHPEPGIYGPGTYPGKGHWDDPHGWWYYDEDGAVHHTYGNPPAMPMYNAAKTLEQEIGRIAQEVFSRND